MYPLNSNVVETQEPPIAEAVSWLRPDNFRPDMALIDVCQAVPGYPPEQGLLDSLSLAARDGDNAFYTDIEGIPPLRKALAQDVSSFYGATVNQDDVLITAGCNQAFMLSIMTLCKAGDSIIVPTPWYFNHKMTLDILNVDTIELPCKIENAMLPDVDEAEACIGDNTKAIVLVSPNNPTGAIYPPALIAKFLILAKRHNIALIIDETYRDFLPADTKRPHGLFEGGFDGGFESADWRDAGFIHLYSFSKVFAMTGYRTGAIIADPRFIVQVAKVMDCMAICAPSLGQQAALYGLENLADWRIEKRHLMDHRITAFSNAMAATETGYKIRSIGAYFAYLEHPYKDKNSTSVAKMLAAERNLLCLPGSMFGKGQDQLLRFAFANVDAERIPEIVDRLTDRLTG